ncbi:hypothetical protein TNCV_3487831 [Trichonephila clavipes]|nr:hypothetical protein TNCV_3487831 [Trichonephila clavipes]
MVTGDVTLDVPLHYHAHVTMFERSERCEQECCHLGTCYPGKRFGSIDLGHQALPSTDLGRLDEEEASPGGRPLQDEYTLVGPE